MADEDLNELVQRRLQPIAVDAGARPPVGPLPVAPAEGDLDEITQRRLLPLGEARKVTGPEMLPPAGQRGWNAGMNMFDAFMLGYGREALEGARGGTGEAARHSLRQRAALPEVQQALRSYESRMAELDASRTAWQKANPGLDLLTTIGGSTPTALAGILGGEAALGATAGRLGARFLPRTTEFLKGQTPGLARIPGLALRGAAEGAASGLETSKLGEGTALEQMQTGAMVGGALNPLTMPLLRGITPNYPAWAQNLAKEMERLGVPVRNAQKPGADLGTRLGDLVGSGEKNLRQRDAYTQALSRLAGQDTSKLDAPAISRAFSDLDRRFDAVAPRLRVAGNDATLIGDLAAIDGNATRELGIADPDKYRAVDRLLTHVQNELVTASASSGFVDGPTFRAMTRYGSTLSNAARGSDPNVRHFAGQIIDAMHEAMVRASPPRDVAELTSAKTHFKNLLVLQEAADPVTGVVNPGKVLPWVERKYGTVDPAKTGDIGTLAMGGDKFLLGEARRPHYEMSDKTKSTLGAIGAAGIGGGLFALGEHGGMDVLSHLVHNPVALGLGIAGTGAGYAGIRAAGPVIRRGVNPLLPAAVELKNMGRQLNE